MARQLVKLNDEGVRAILTGPGVVRYLEDWGERVNRNAHGAGYGRTENSPGGFRLAPRARVRVYDKIQRMADTGNLLMALDETR